MTEQCSICFCGLAEDLAITKCEHIFHQACIAKWLGSKPHAKCPQCRKKLTPKKGLTKFRLNPLELVLGALAKPAEYIDAFEGINKTKLQLAFSKLQSDDSTKIEAPSKEEIGSEARKKAMEIMRQKIQQLESENIDLEDSKNTLERKVLKQAHKADHLQLVNIQISSQFSLESSKNRQLIDENIRLKKDAEERRWNEINNKKELAESKRLQEEMSENLNRLSCIEAFKANISGKEVMKLDDILKNKNEKQALRIVTDFYLYLRGEHTQLQNQIKNQQQSEQGDLDCLREQISTYRLENNELRERITLHALTVKKYKSRLKKMVAERRKQDNSTPTQNMNDSVQSLETPTLPKGGGFFPLKFDSGERSRTKEKIVREKSPKKPFFPQGRMKRKNPFAQTASKRKPLRL